MTIRKLLLPGLLAAVLVAPAALAQVDVGARGGAALGAQAGPVDAKAQVGVDAAAHSDAVHEHSDAVHEAAAAAKATGEQVGDAARTAARTGAKAADQASAKAVDAVSSNAKAKAGANAAVSGEASAGEDEPEEDDGN